MLSYIGYWIFEIYDSTGDFNITVEEAVLIKKLVVKRYSPLLAGQVIEIIEAGTNE